MWELWLESSAHFLRLSRSSQVMLCRGLQITSLFSTSASLLMFNAQCFLHSGIWRLHLLMLLKLLTQRNLAGIGFLSRHPSIQGLIDRWQRQFLLYSCVSTSQRSWKVILVYFTADIWEGYDSLLFNSFLFCSFHSLSPTLYPFRFSAPGEL